MFMCSFFFFFQFCFAQILKEHYNALKFYWQHPIVAFNGAMLHVQFCVT